MFEQNFTEAKALLDDIIQNGVTAAGEKYALLNYARTILILRKKIILNQYLLCKCLCTMAQLVQIMEISVMF